MKSMTEKNTYLLQNGNTTARFLESGDIYALQEKNILINQFLGNPRDGGEGRLYLKLWRSGSCRTFELTGIRSESSFGITADTAQFWGKAEDVSYEVRFSIPAPGLLLWEVILEGEEGEAELIFGQDLALSTVGGTLTNELYVSQYLGYEVFETESGTVLCARQNMSQEGRFPFLQLGCVNTRAVKFSTDAMQFFGKSYRDTNVPKTEQEDLENRRYQYEMSYAALQTERIPLMGRVRVGFYALVQENHPQVIQGVEDTSSVQKAWEKMASCTQKAVPMPRPRAAENMGEVYSSPEADLQLLDRLYPSRKMEEYHQGRLISFFAGEHTHVVLKEKELLVERPHAHIIMTNPSSEEIDNEILASTNYMFGVFQSQLVVGNTSMHKMLSVSRGMLNLFKSSGQRIYVLLDGKYRLLTLPAIYEMGLNYSRWYYRIGEDVLEITASCLYGRPDSRLEIRSLNGRKYRLLISSQCVMGEQEDFQNICTRITEDGFVLTAEEGSLPAKTYPDLHFEVYLEGGAWEIHQDDIFYQDGRCRDRNLLVVATEETDSFCFHTCGRLSREKKNSPVLSFRENCDAYDLCYRNFLGGIRLEMPEENPQIEKLQEMLWWYAHDALIHYISPHGVEQPGGAAWGTRDVCQGPVEFLMSTGHMGLVRKLILRVFTHQFMESGEWPQWFMFDGYDNIMQFDCHGDVVFWPLKMVGDYLTRTGDYSILDCKLSYHSQKDGVVTEQEETLLAHLERAYDSIRRRFVGNTHLITYAGGDWDDTLQPASEELKKSLISTWTVALAYQVLSNLSQVLPESDFRKELEEAVLEIGEDFRRYGIAHGIIPGFLKTEEKGRFSYLLHPEDRETGIQYRLLPMTRSILAGLVSKEQAEKNMELIQENLLCPDGVRLMNRPATYSGGNPKVFRRADQAANVGREIGLMYTHAHIRYMEALAVMGQAEEAWHSLEVINPIAMEKVVPNAVLRQCNCYYSSSDADFPDRYAFQEQSEKMYRGEVAVRGGWRVYSSGSGICINQIITALIGLRQEKGTVILNPVIPASLDGLTVTVMLEGRETRFTFHVKEQKIRQVLKNGSPIQTEMLGGIYREGGCILGSVSQVAGNRYDILF